MTARGHTRINAMEHSSELGRQPVQRHHCFATQEHKVPASTAHFAHTALSLRQVTSIMCLERCLVACQGMQAMQVLACPLGSPIKAGKSPTPFGVTGTTPGSQSVAVGHCAP